MPHWQQQFYTQAEYYLPLAELTAIHLKTGRGGLPLRACGKGRPISAILR
jgi:hypothetical protein